MSQEIITMIREDSQLQESLKESASKSEAVTLIISAASKKGQSYTEANVEAALDELSSSMSSDESLSDEELQQVAGGLPIRKPSVYTDAFCCDTTWVTVNPNKC